MTTPTTALAASASNQDNSSALNDQPIASPEHDHFELDPFARTVARSISRMPAPYGTVIAITGPWGAGKSSAINLCKHHLKQLNDEANAKNQTVPPLEIVNFACWWFRGQEALTLAFFQALYAALGKSDNSEIKEILAQLGANTLRSGASVLGQVVGAVATGISGPLAAIAGGLTEKTVNWLADQIRQDPKSIEELHIKLSAALKKSPKRFLVVIDDIDRLSPDDALLIFRLVKSVGHLPKIIYLLAYDRQIAEKIVSQQFPSEGPHYLEKIVQATFEVPYPTLLHIQQKLKADIEAICPIINTENERDYLDNFFYPILFALIRTPRDMARFVNILRISWPAVADEVECKGFLAIEILRIFYPPIYWAIRHNKDILTRKRTSPSSEPGVDAEAYFDKLFFADKSPPQANHLRTVLVHLFHPVLSRAWPAIERWFRGRAQLGKYVLALTPLNDSEHFDAYFRFSAK